jgi:probable rRNA maturation factor
MARVHREFLGVPGTTDVITFQHGEILVCPEVASREAASRHIPFREELLRYCVHGWLHLRGMDDHEPADADLMHARQEYLVKNLCSLPRSG